MKTLVIPANLAQELRKLFEAAPLESGGVLYCREACGLNDVKLLGVEFSPYEEDEYRKRTAESLTVDPVAVNERIQRANRDGLSIVQVHTHPASEQATFSSVDAAGEDEMMPVIARRLPDRVHATLVLGRSSSSVRFYDRELNRNDGRIVSVGAKIERLDHLRVGTIDRFVRSYLALGKGGQAALQDMTIGVVGLGGLGSVVAEQLSYLGVERVVLIDPDHVEESNLNRVVGAVPSDVRRNKVEVAAARYRSVLPSATVDMVVGSIIDERVARAIVDCDLAFCCTDGHGSRAVLSWLAYQYLVPVVDVGVQIDVFDETVAAIAGRVQLVGPGMPCLHCCESLDANRVREEFMTEEERARDAYVTGAAVAQPAVVTFNSVAASLATTMLLGLATPLRLAARMQTFNAMTGQVRPAEATPKDGCPFCSASSAVFGLGDSLPGIWRKDVGLTVSRYRFVSFGPVKRVVTQTDAQAHACTGGIGLVMAGKLPKMAVFACPDGCGQTLKINLMRQMGRAWTASVDRIGRLTLSPSVDLSGGCRAHFILGSNVARVIYA
ncbi:MAG: ThiF family adenylyltransferase [Candidatus Eremiobacteraeota bacterium]|nr:ThiF family adenylyltransferase [Candidatus Eremiobacteraeota bacterium]